MAIVIVPVTRNDVDKLPFREMMEEVEKYGGPPPSLKNVDTYKRLCLRGIVAQDPVLVAWHDDMEWSAGIAGFICWVGLEDTIDPGPKTLTGLGTYVAPEFRRSGVAGRLRAAAFQKAKDRGYERVIGTVHFDNEAGLASTQRDGFKDLYKVVVKEL